MTATAVRPEQKRQDRTPPHDIAAEQAVLGAMLINKMVIGDVIELVTAEDFYRPAHATIFNAILRLYADNHPVDGISVTNALGEQALTMVGGAPYIYDLIDSVPVAASGTFYARIVAEKATFRRLVEAGMAVTQIGYGHGIEVDQAVDRAQQEIYNVTNERSSSTAMSFLDLVQPALDGIEASAANAGTLRGVPTGFIDLDKLFNGLKPGQMVIVAGRPGQGKSTLGIGMAVNAAVKHGIPSAVFSLEMSNNEIMERILSSQCRVPFNIIQSGALTDDDWTKIARRLGDLGDVPLYLDDSPNLTMMEARAKARRLVLQHGVKFLVVDYVQLQPTDPRIPREQQIADLSRGWKLLAKELQIPIIVIAQLNRESEQRSDKIPQLSDLRGSGSLEQDADIVILVFRPDYYDKESPRAGEADLIVAKHRGGPTDTITVASQLHLARFTDMSIDASPN